MKNITLIEKAFLLKRTPPFCGLDLDLLLTIADKLGHVRFQPTDFIFNVGEEANRMYFIATGQVQLNTSSHFFLIESGDYFGDEALFNNQPRCYSAKAESRVDLLTLSRTNLYTIISECPSVGIGFLQSYTSIVTLRACSKSLVG